MFKQRDGMFGGSGEWKLKRCTKEQCLLFWLDRMPAEEDIGKAYALLAHASSGRPDRAEVVKRGYLGAINFPVPSRSHALDSFYVCLRSAVGKRMAVVVSCTAFCCAVVQYGRTLARQVEAFRSRAVAIAVK